MEPLETILSVLVIVGLAYWIWHANRHANNAEIRPPPAPGAPDDQVFTSNSRPAPPPPDPFDSEVETARLAAEQKTNEERERYQKAIEEKLGDDEALKARLSKFALDNRLDVALVEVWEEIRTYPAASGRETWLGRHKLDVTDTREEILKDPLNVALWFSYEGHRYKIEANSWIDMGGGSNQDFRLLENDEEMFSISTSVKDVEYRTYRTSDVKALKKRGTWASMLVRLHAQHEANQHKRSADWRAYLAADIKAKFAE